MCSTQILIGTVSRRPLCGGKLHHFLKKKLDEAIKNCGCADERKQQSSAEKIEAATPTILTEVAPLTISIAAKEKSNIASMEVPGPCYR